MAKSGLRVDARKLYGFMKKDIREVLWNNWTNFADGGEKKI